MQNIIVNFVRNSPISCTQTIVSSFKTYKNDDITTLSVQLGAWPQRLVLGPGPRVLLNITTEYNPIALARSIRSYFERNPQAIEVLVYKGRKSISVLRADTINGASFFKYFVAKYIQ